MLRCWIGLLIVAGLTEAWDVETNLGTVRGQTLTINVATGIRDVTSFWGIPYAKPPINELRFKPPEPALPWEEEVFVASELPHMCMQNPLGLMFMTHPLWTDFDEDCLTLNVFSQEDWFGPPMPVMVWFHGGGYTGGGSIQYPGHFLAARGVVVVTVNYRLGVFGFASTSDGTIKGNMGMLDQVMALRWVRDNIAAFNGNPNNVLIFGQSAGASSAALHVISPISQGLFHKAIFESGAESNVWSLNYPPQEPELYIYQVAERARCTTESIPAMVDCLMGLSATVLRIADNIECHEGFFCQGFAPIVDGPGGFMPDYPLTLREQLGEKSVPIIAGHCKDDGSLYTIYFIREMDDGGCNRTMFQYYLRTRLVDIFKAQFTPQQYEDAYQGMDFFYTPWPYIEDEDANREAFNKLLTEAAFGVTWDMNAKLNSQYADTYTYIQSHLSPNSTSFIPAWMGVPHNGELAYVWAYSYLLTHPLVRLDTGINFDIVGWTPEDWPYSDFVQTMWANFATYGNPTPSPIKMPFNDSTIVWPKYTMDDNIKLLDLDTIPNVKETYRQQQYAFYREYAPYVLGRRPPTPPDTKKSAGSGFRLKSSMFQKRITEMVEKLYTSRYPGQYEEIFAQLKKEHQLE